VDDRVIKHQDLAATEKPIADSDRPPPSTRMEGETIEIQVKSRALLLVALVLLVATFAHFALALNGFVSLVLALAVIVAICHPEHATGVLTQMSGLTSKFRSK
jgi:hypothetical protein